MLCRISAEYALFRFDACGTTDIYSIHMMRVHGRQATAKREETTLPNFTLDPNNTLMECKENNLQVID